jgi:hypothetical protein
MENEEKAAAADKRRLQVYVDNDDILSRVLDVPEADYECVRVNGSWLEKGLAAGDMVLIVRGPEPGPGDIIWIEEDGRERLGLMHEPGWLETIHGVRPLNANEHIIGVGIALVRRLHKG